MAASSSATVSNGRPPASASMVALRVINAEILRNFETFGKMDPYVIVRMVASDGTAWQVSRTWTHWDGHLAPRWDHTCRAQPHDGVDRVEFQLYEDDMVGKDDWCGTAVASMRELVLTSTKTGEINTGPIQRLEIKLKGEITGYINVQAVVFEMSAMTYIEKQPQKRLPKDMFATPALQLSVSGGTAPFYKLRLRAPVAGQSAEHFIGKDLSHALDEVHFYEEMRLLREGAGNTGISRLLDFAFEYAGIANSAVSSSQAAGKESTSGKLADLLVLRNLQDGYKRLRLLDIKLGSKTSQAGWHGKSRVAALRQSLIDGLTNSCAEGFRLEGFENMPATLKSMDPLLDLGGSHGSKSAKKARRIALQIMHGPEVLMHFLDLHNEPDLVQETGVGNTLTATEVSEIVLHEIVQRMVRLCLVCHQAPVPQKWIGSSVALGFEAGSLPDRPSGESVVRKRVQVNIFDWGRSELNTMEKHHRLVLGDQHDRSKYWAYYVGGMTRLTWDIARVYWNRFACPQWGKVFLSVVDYDSLSSDDFIGRVTIETLAPTPPTTVDLPATLLGQITRTVSSMATLTYSIEWQAFPASSRLKGTWRIHILKANNLPRLDKVLMKTTSDPYVEVLAVSADGAHCARQRTAVSVSTLNPVWDEVIEFPEIGTDDVSLMQTTLAGLRPGLGEEALEDVLLSEIKIGPSSSNCGCGSRSSKSTHVGVSSSTSSIDVQKVSQWGKRSDLEKGFLAWESIVVKAAREDIGPLSKEEADPDASLRTGETPERVSSLIRQCSQDLSAMLQEIREADEAQASDANDAVNDESALEPNSDSSKAPNPDPASSATRPQRIVWDLDASAQEAIPDQKASNAITPPSNLAGAISAFAGQTEGLKRVENDPLLSADTSCVCKDGCRSSFPYCHCQ